MVNHRILKLQDFMENVMLFGNTMKPNFAALLIIILCETLNCCLSGFLHLKLKPTANSFCAVNIHIKLYC